jgi:hypothetical protein
MSEPTWQPRKLPDSFVKDVNCIYEPMAEAGKPGFDEPGPLRSIVRLTVDFHNYLETVDLDSPNQADAQYAAFSIFSGIESFTYVNLNYRILVGALESRLEWKYLTSLHSLKDYFESMYREFLAKQTFEEKCRLLLDLFKLQIVFTGMLFN